jgi:tetratricopeptide (TPR) repeat protein
VTAAHTAAELHASAVRHLEAGRVADAAAAALHAVTLRESLVTSDPGEREPLAVSLYLLSIAARELGRPEDAVGYAERAVEICRPLAVAQPQTRARLVAALNTHAAALAAVGRDAEALAAQEEALPVAAALAAEDPQNELSALSGTTINLANALNGVGRHAEALDAIEQLLLMYVEIADAGGDVSPRELPPALITGVNALLGVGRVDDGRVMAEAAVEAARELARMAPQTETAVLARALHTLAVVADRRGDTEARIAPLTEEIEILRPLARERPVAVEPELAAAEANLADALADTGRTAEALMTIHGTLERHRRVLEADPERFLGELLRLLNNRVVLFDELGDRNGAAAAREELAAFHRWMKAVVEAGPPE